jgi:hypothetical protein
MPARSLRLLLTSVVLLVVGTAALQAQTWTRHSYATDGFEVEFSGRVDVSPTAVDGETRSRIFRATNYLQDGGDFAFIVAASLQRVPVNFENGVEQSIGALKCATTISNTTLPFSRGRAREVRATGCVSGKFRAHARYFTQGSWFYQVLALHPVNGSREAEAQRFVESFRVTGPGRQ